MRATPATTNGGVNVGSGPEQVPIGTSAKGDWSEGAGDGDGSAHDELDEGRAAFDDATSYWKIAAANTTVLILQMTARTTPAAPTTMRLRWRFRSQGLGTPVMTFSCAIYEGSTLRYTDPQANPAAAWTTGDPGAIDLSAISNWSNVYVRLSQSAGDADDWVEVTGVSIDET